MATLKTILARLGDRANIPDKNPLNDLGAGAANNASRDSFIEDYNATYDFDAGWADVCARAGVDPLSIQQDSGAAFTGTPSRAAAGGDGGPARWRRWVWRHVVPDPHDPPLVALAAFGVVLHSGWPVAASVAGLAYAAWWRRAARRHAAAAAQVAGRGAAGRAGCGGQLEGRR
jgi:hypothetical protein